MNQYLIIIAFIASYFTGHSQQNLDSITKTAEGTANHIYKIISGEKGEERDWETFRMLFASDAQFRVLIHDSTGKGILRTFAMEEFVRSGKRFYEQHGFLEYPLKTVINEYNGIATVFQSYYAKEENFEEEGVNILTMIHDGKRWWITSVMWTSNQNGVELPEEYRK